VVGTHTADDLLLLDHENAELLHYLARLGNGYSEAHNTANQIADWWSAVTKR
jgi:hypothetical protein